MAPLNINTTTTTNTTIPAISNQNLAKVSTCTRRQQEGANINMNASEEDYRDSIQSPLPLIQKQRNRQRPRQEVEEGAVQEEEPAINHHNAIMGALRRRVKSSKYKFRDGDGDADADADANVSSTSTRRGLRNRLRDRQSKRKEKRLRLIGQHYKIDQNNRILLPGVPKYDEDLTRDVHDFFNLIFLVPIVALNVLNWNWDELYYQPHSKDGIPFIDCWTGDYFNVFFYTTVAYFIIDLLFVTFIPKAVKSPATIIQHHIASLIYLAIPYKVETFRFLFGVCMSVEINTWFLIARRVFNKQGFPPWTIDLPYLFSIKVKLISIFFYITWISIRCLLYPYVSVVFYRMAKVRVLTEEEKVALSIGVCLHVVFCALNCRWTIDLVNSKIRQWKSKGKSNTGMVESGL